MTPAEHTRIVLAEFRSIGTPFTQAWASAMRSLPRRQPEYREWKDVLAWARPAFRAYYEGCDYEVMGDDGGERSWLVCTGQPQRTRPLLTA